MPDLWICTDCRSANTASAKRCYRCRGLRANAEMHEATAAFARASAQQTTTVLAAAARQGARYRRSWPLAVLVVPLIVVATGLDIARTAATAATVSPDGRMVESKAAFDQVITLSALDLGAVLVATLAWSFWIALVVSNVPALTARWPPNSPIGAFFAPFIPFIGLKRPYSVVRNVLRLLAPGQIAPFLIALAWWWTLLAAYFVPGFLLALAAREPGQTLFQSTILATVVRLGFLIPAALLAIGLVVIIERAQRRALAERATIVLSAAELVPQV